MRLPVVLATSLVFDQRSRIGVKAQESNLKSLAPGNGIGNGRSSNYEALIFHTRQSLESLELLGKGLPMRLVDLFLELEQHCHMDEFHEEGQNLRGLLTDMNDSHDCKLFSAFSGMLEISKAYSLGERDL